MDMPDNKENKYSDDEAVEKALSEGRNANDNFKEGEVDDYGTDGSEDEKIERNDYLSGSDQDGKQRNRNDDFNGEDEE